MRRTSVNGTINETLKQSLSIWVSCSGAWTTSRQEVCHESICVITPPSTGLGSRDVRRMLPYFDLRTSVPHPTFAWQQLVACEACRCSGREAHHPSSILLDHRLPSAAYVKLCEVQRALAKSGAGWSMPNRLSLLHTTGMTLRAGLHPSPMNLGLPVSSRPALQIQKTFLCKHDSCCSSLYTLKR